MTTTMSTSASSSSAAAAVGPAVKRSMRGRRRDSGRGSSWTTAGRSRRSSGGGGRAARRASVVAAAGEGQAVEEEENPLDIPREWVKASPTRRPDVFREFPKYGTEPPILPQKLPEDPPVEEELGALQPPESEVTPCVSELLEREHSILVCIICLHDLLL